MTIDDLTTQLRAVRDVLAAQADLGRLEEYALVAGERLWLAWLDRAHADGLARSAVLDAGGTATSGVHLHRRKC
jgi:hypothetical protein